jgi:hypothetical protein
MEKKIIAKVYYDNGSQGFETAYDPETSVEAYIEHFRNETKRMNVTHTAEVEHLKVTLHDENGDYKMADNGSRLEEYIYKIKR